MDDPDDVSSYVSSNAVFEAGEVVALWVVNLWVAF